MGWSLFGTRRSWSSRLDPGCYDHDEEEDEDDHGEDDNDGNDVDHCLELVVADPPVSVLIFLLVIDDYDDSGDDDDDDYLTTWSAYVNISSISTSLTWQKQMFECSSFQQQKSKDSPLLADWA